MAVGRERDMSKEEIKEELERVRAELERMKEELRRRP